ncbi:MAG: DEAD/DEAH box helicase family protein [Clostridium sp.]|uniref:DEAD/DEAH box helicase family protein n=1 Tax=Clostridium TaxID=1485 RepID=UPI0018993474|nr:MULTISPECIES: DEAD/DEAH box helicase family protein [Clostridium]MDU5209340.1 DEAD/DEAH box helicase family protein [Clostridium sp.]MDU6761516.1 DEAD/DEAH box helicase family protein [Clostridium sp.]
MVTKINIDTIEHKEITNNSISLNNAITGGKNNYLYYRLKESFKKAKKIDIIVSFLMESGVKLIFDDLREVLDRGVEIRILTGNYLNITQPQALYLLKGGLKDKIDLRFYNVPNKSFHPKSYIFHGDLDSEIYVGSSNISRGALTNSIEWNYRFLKSQNEDDFNEFYNTFEDLFYNHSLEIDDTVLKAYSKSWKRPNVYKDIEKEEEETNVIDLYEPKGAQIEALYGLSKSREEGFDKGLVVAATGVGKTYLAAFDSKDYKRVLFVAHREEIIKQAAQSFKNVRNNEAVGFFYNSTKDKDKNLIFALVQTLGKDEYLNENYFARDYFDYIVVDEFHHAVSKNYRKIIDYFEPKFLLGLTATPERLDSKDVFALCDYNMVYEVRLVDAINKGWLVPFRYYGVYDETIDYSQLHIKNGKYDDKELEQKLMLNSRANLILKHYEKYNSKRAMGFCSSKGHAEYMAKYFTEHGVDAVAVYSGESGEYSEERNIALNNLSKGEIKVIFSVDMFNEGLDIPSIDMVIFLRPTQSPTVFLQQLGRGLRKYKGKEYLNVLDFIGNYKRADLIPFLLSGRDYSVGEWRKGKPSDFKYPDDCIVNFDFKIVDMFKKLAEKEMSIKDRVKAEYYEVKEQLGHRPSRVEFFTYMDDEIYEELRKKAKFNPLNNYLEFLNENGELLEAEETLYNGRGREFINMIETTSMSKTYKMPLLLAFYNRGDIKMDLTENDIYIAFKEFYSHGSNRIDIKHDKDKQNLDKWEKKQWVNLAVKNPVHFMIKTHRDFMVKRDGHVVGLADDLEPLLNNEGFKMHMLDAIGLRIKTYYKNRFIDRK